MVCVLGVADGSLTIGDTVLFVTMINQLYVPLTYFGSYYRQVRCSVVKGFSGESELRTGGGEGVVWTVSNDCSTMVRGEGQQVPPTACSPSPPHFPPPPSPPFPLPPSPLPPSPSPCPLPSPCRSRRRSSTWRICLSCYTPNPTCRTPQEGRSCRCVSWWGGRGGIGGEDGGGYILHTKPNVQDPPGARSCRYGVRGGREGPRLPHVPCPRPLPPPPPITLTPPIQVFRGEVRFDNVVFGYNPVNPVLKGVSFIVPGVGCRVYTHV